MSNYLVLDPAKYGLNKRLKIYKNSDEHLIIEKVIKSRIIQKDAQKIIDIAKQLSLHIPQAKITLRCRNNICSKSVKLLADSNIDLEFTN